MPIAHSKLTAQGQTSVPVEVRRKLALAPGSVLEWEEKGGEGIVRRAVRYTSIDVHNALFGVGAKAPLKVDVQAAIRKHVCQRHARE